ncbi:Ulp1 protease family, C-terminal catalytic domain [Sesbania bispinosa]|nr:Ulp1 protease family, C-terminal catalytic domain [Sesbania bispinosa]
MYLESVRIRSSTMIHRGAVIYKYIRRRNSRKHIKSEFVYKENGIERRYNLRLSNRKGAKRTDPCVEEMASQVGVPDAQTNNKKDRVIVEVSSKDTQSNLQSQLRVKKRKEESGDWNPSTEEICMKQNPLEDRIGNMENQMTKVISSIDLLTQHIVGSKSQSSNMNLQKPSLQRLAMDALLLIGIRMIVLRGYWTNFGKSLRAIFKPSKPMYLSKEEAEVGSYIFCNNLDTEYDNIVMVQGVCLHCLKPKLELEQDVINLAVCMMTMREKNGLKDPSNWFLPTTYAQFVLAWSTPPEQMIEHYYDSFMGKVDLLSKVFIPVNDGNFHWYLIVIDFIQKERTPKPLVSKYTIHIPEGLKIQNANSNDCGAWVIMWMVDEGSRLRIALDLAMNPGNILREMVKKRAEDWVQTLTGDDGGEN